jgi:anti-sigma regulatory factor (Ser/Thr protein kinase)
VWVGSPETTRPTVKKAATVSRSAVYPLGAHSASPGIARARVSRFLEGRTGPELGGIAALIVSELVTNAVVHGCEPIRLQLRIDAGVLHIDVSDSDPGVDAVAAPAPGDRTTVSGRGLRIVETLADTWGVAPDGRGKTVWATMPLRTAPPRERAGEPMRVGDRVR